MRHPITDAHMLASFSVTPLGAGDSVGDVVAGCVRIVRDSGLPNETSAMFTTVEGDWDEIQQLVGTCMAYAAEHAPRVSVVMKIDHRPGHGGTLRSKVERVEQALAEGRAPHGQGAGTDPASPPDV